jgi:hypothetical protein
MAKKQVPKRLWDYGLIYESELLSRMARGSDRRTGYKEVTGQTPDISEWMDFAFTISYGGSTAPQSQILLILHVR